MATTPTNNLKRVVKGQHLNYKLLGSNNINQGDLVTFVTSGNNQTVRSSANDADGANQVGVALQTFPVTSLGIGDGNNKATGIEIGWGDVFTFKTTSGDNYHDGDQVWIGADAQTVTNTNNNFSNVVGYVRMGADTAVPIAGGTAVFVDIEVMRRFPSVNLT